MIDNNMLDWLRGALLYELNCSELREMLNSYIKLRHGKRIENYDILHRSK